MKFNYFRISLYTYIYVPISPFYLIKLLMYIIYLIISNMGRVEFSR